MIKLTATLFLRFFVPVFFILFFSFCGLAQVKDTTASFKFGGYADAYYAYYSDSVGTTNYQKFPAVSPRSNVFGLNVLQLTGQYTSDKIRSAAALFFGDIPASAWSPVFNFLQEANIGYRLSKKIWLDAGLFKTHIGTEALMPRENIASSLSIITLYEPWFQSGIKLSIAPNNRLSFCLHILNGYNTFVETNKKKSIGVTILYLLGEKGSIGYYNLLGDETPDNIKTSHFRTLHNLVFNYDLSKKLKLSTGVDYISQSHSDISDSTKTASIYSAILTLRYQVRSKLGIYLRGEMFSDQSGFLTGRILDANKNYHGYTVNGATVGFEYKMNGNSFIRLESRELFMAQAQQIFRNNGTNTNQRLEVMLHTGIWF
jgi:hypothetical protein